MAYKKLLIDNTTCSRRFHITFDDEATNLPRVELRCPHCNVTIMAENNHPSVTLVREENLVKTANLSDNLTSACQFEDTLSAKTTPQYHGKAPNAAKQP